MSTPRKNVCLFGASPTTGNQGVNALCWSTVAALSARIDAEFRVFGYGAGETAVAVPGGTSPLTYRLDSVSVGRRVWKANHLRRAEYAASVGWSGNPLVRTVRDADLVLDVSGGDSFTDLYGASRFNDIVAPKRIALSTGSRLVLLPQTYGPFASPRSERIAREIVTDASLAYARDRDSYERLQSMLGSRFDAERHRLGVDVAFGLPARQPATVEPEVQRALKARGDRPLIGLNVSGLLANRPAASSERFSLASDYRQLVATLVTRLLETSDAHLLLVPHVHAPRGHYESDLDACLELVETLPDRLRAEADERVTLLRRQYDAMELKWIIGQTEWFCGSRMHSTIAALSSGVAACAMAYSLKTRGVFASCGVEQAAVDLRSESAGDALQRVLWTFENRESLSATLASKLPRVRAVCSDQFDAIASSPRLMDAA